MVHIAIIGSGLIGQQWALIYASGGHHVRLFDTLGEQVDLALNAIYTRFVELEESSNLRGHLTASEQTLLVKGTCSLDECVKGAEIVQECVPENLELKQSVFQQIDNLIEEDTVAICSSSSCLPISQIAQGLKRLNQCLVSHPINPPYFLPLVELIPGPSTLPSVVQQVRSLLSTCGQEPVVLNREVAGFAVNRIQYAIINECWDLVQTGVMSASDVDKVMQFGLGPRYAFYGPFSVMHLNAPNGFEDYCKRYGSGMQKVSAQLNTSLPNYEEEPALSLITKEMKEAVPLEQMKKAQRRRETRLSKFKAFLRRLEQEEAEEDARMVE